MKLTKKQSFIIIGVFFLVALAFTTSLAFYTFSRTGTKRISITAGAVTFSYNEGDSATLASAFPISDTVGAVDTTGEYLFDVTYNGTKQVNYNVYLVSNNTDTSKNYFNNQFIKYALVKNNNFIGDTTATKGKKLTEVAGFNSDSHEGEGIILENQAISKGQQDFYKLRIWIADDVDYTNTIDENGTSTGKYNGYEYSLKVKIATSDLTITINDVIPSADGKIKTTIKDEIGLKGYAITTSKVAPTDESAWTLLNGEKEKEIEYKATQPGTYYIHVKNNNDAIATKEVKVDMTSPAVTVGENGNINTEITSTKPITGYAITKENTAPGTGDSSWQAGNNTTTQEINYNPTEPGKYYIHVNDSDGTVRTIEVTIPMTNTQPQVEASGKITTTIKAMNPITGYVVTKSETAPGTGDSSWQAGNNTTTQNINYNPTEPGTYYIHVKDTQGNIKTVKVVVSVIAVNLKNEIMKNPAKTTYTLTTTSQEANENGLFKSTNTNDGSPTYFFRGNVQNNYVKFANLDWRIIRINEDGTIRIRLANGINNDQNYQFNSVNNTYDKMYYTNSTLKPIVDNWYQEAIGNNPTFASKVVTGNYFCEQAKVKYSESDTSGNATMTTYTSYTPNFKCATDGNGKGYVNSQVGLITYDELIHAGGYIYPKTDYMFYLFRAYLYDWSMSPGAFNSSYVNVRVWNFGSGSVNDITVNYNNGVLPVLNLSADVLVTGTGTSTDPFVIQ